MNQLILLRGVPGCGKSTFVKKMEWEQYTLSADTLRLMCQSPILLTDGSCGISGKDDKTVWRILYELLEVRMSHGDFTVIDATHCNTRNMQNYHLLAKKYDYSVYCVDFSDVPLETALYQNANREEYKRVPDDVIYRMHENLKECENLNWITYLCPTQAFTYFDTDYRLDLSEYKRVHHIGDIHGCMTVLGDYLELASGDRLQADEYYIFCGDYLDRGIENVDVMRFLLNIMDCENVCFLEGNHERWLRAMVAGNKAYSKEFEYETKPQLLKAGIEQQKIKEFLSKLKPCLSYTYRGQEVFVSHGGVSDLPKAHYHLSSEQTIFGVGNYEDMLAVDTSFHEKNSSILSIHGHRNIEGVPIQVNETCFNLEGKVELGGSLRCLILQEGGVIPMETTNHIIKPEYQKKQSEDMIGNMRDNPMIKEKKFGPISSFNFTRKAFQNGIWNKQTIQARGLYVDTNTNSVVARAYDKFFAINERPETDLDVLKNTLKFPLKCYVKENGYLGLVSYNPYEKDFFITTKSDPTGDYAGWLKEIFYQKTSVKTRKDLLEYLKHEKATFVFECIDVENDPHIIEYDENQLILLDCVSNDSTFKKVDYQILCELGKRFGMKVKDFAKSIDSADELVKWYEEVTKPDYQYLNQNVEGFVLEDANGFMAKVKCHYYRFWKWMRSTKDAVKRAYKKGIPMPSVEKFHGDKEAEAFFDFLIFDIGEPDTLELPIITLRKMYFKEH